MKYTVPTVIASAALAAAHGYVDSGLIGGKTYEFYQPYADPYASPAPDRISRFIAGNGPVLDITSKDMTCGGGSGSGSKPAALHAPAAAGSKVELTWTTWAESHVGPVITYMARCPDAGCQDYEPGSDAVWFKIQEGGREGVTNTWATTPLTKAGGVAEYTIPACLSPGYYLVRHEIIALHAGAEFYPGCHQLEVTGSGSTVPTGLVSFPGAYSASDAGIDYSPFQQTKEYTIPGPALFTCGGGSAPAPTTAVAAPTAAATTTTAPAVVSATAAPVPTEPVEDDCPVDDGDDEEPVDDEDDCPADDEEEPVDDEDDCPVDAEEEDDDDSGLDPVAVDDEDDCPADDEEEPVEDEDDCPADDDEEPVDDEDDCPADDEEPVDDEDDCPADDDEETVEQPGYDDEYEDIDDCEEETVPTKRQTFHERRMNY